MKIRLMGTREECDAVAAALKTALDVREVSGWYPNRGPDTVLGRLYVDAVAAAPTLTVGQVLTAASPEPPPGSIVRGVDALIWERGGEGGNSPSWFRAGNYGPVFLDHIEGAAA